MRQKSEMYCQMCTHKKWLGTQWVHKLKGLHKKVGSERKINNNLKRKENGEIYIVGDV